MIINPKRAKRLLYIQRIGVSVIRYPEQLIHRLEDIALEINDTLTDAIAEGDGDWWMHQDLLDDVMDVLDYVKKDLQPGDTVL